MSGINEFGKSIGIELVKKQETTALTKLKVTKITILNPGNLVRVSF